MQVRKTLKFSDTGLSIQVDTGTFEGYASKWGGVDSYGDTIVKGAFAETLKNATPKMFWNHSWDMPVGKWTDVGEDSTGLFVKGELTPGLTLSGDVRAAMKHGTLDGLSVGGFLKKGDYDEKAGGRLIHKWSTLAEISPVAFPADASARIDLSSVKNGGPEIISEIDEITTIKEFEYLLRYVAGLSKGAAKSLTARAYILFGSADAETSEKKAMQEIEDRIKRLASF
jgi:HK97 family phage prohead protease